MEHRNLAEYFCARLWPWFIAPKKFKLGDQVLVTNKSSAFVFRSGSSADIPEAPGLFKTEFKGILDGLEPCSFSTLRSLLKSKKSEIDASMDFCRACSSSRHILCPWCRGDECYDCDGSGTLPCPCGDSLREYPHVAVRIRSVFFDARILSRAWGVFSALKSSAYQLNVTKTKKALAIKCDWGLYLQSGCDLENHTNCQIWEVES